MRLFFLSNRKRRAFGFIGLLLLSISAVAEEGSVLAPVVVTANPVLVDQTYPGLAAGQVTVITADEFRADQFSVADVLEAAPAVQVQSSGELGSFQSVTVRGAPGRQLLVYLDGVLLSSASGESVDLSQLALDQVTTIEIYRSVAPPQFAQDAMGGVVNIVTRHAVEQRNSRIAVKAGSFGLLETNVSHHQSGDLAALSLYAGALSSRNDFPYRYNNGTPAVSSDDIEVRRNNADYQRYHGSADVKTLGDSQQWQAGLGWRYSKKSLPRWNNDDSIDTYYREREWRASLGWSQIMQPGRRFGASVRLLAQDSQGHLYDPTAAVGLAANDSHDRDQSLSLNPLLVANGDRHLLTLAGETGWARFSVDDVPNDVAYRHERLSQAVSITDELTAFADRLNFSISVRHLSAIDETSLWGGHLAAQWLISDRLSWEVLAKKSFRMPSLFERYGNQGYFRGNDQLDSEDNYLLETSLQARGDRFDWGLTTFYRIAQNNIAPVYDSQGVGHYVNIGEVYHQGFEWQGQFHNDRYRLFHQGSFQPSRVYSDTLAYDGNQAPGYYPITVDSGLEITLQPWTLGVNWRYQQGLYYDRANSTQAPERSEINLSARRQWALGKLNHQFDFAVTNLLDQRSQDMTNKPLPGRSFSAGYVLNF